MPGSDAQMRSIAMHHIGQDEANQPGGDDADDHRPIGAQDERATDGDDDGEKARQEKEDEFAIEAEIAAKFDDADILHTLENGEPGQQEEDRHQAGLGEIMRGERRCHGDQRAVDEAAEGGKAEGGIKQPAVVLTAADHCVLQPGGRHGIEGGSLGQAFVRTVAVIVMFVLPAAIGISAMAGYIVEIALGPKWAATIIIIELIAASSPMTVIALMAATTLMASGHVRNSFVIILISAVLGTSAAALMAIAYGLPGVAASTAVLAVLEGMAFLAMIARIIDVPMAAMVSNLWRPLLATTIMVLVLWTSGYGWQPQPQSAAAEALATILIGAGTYAVTLALSWILARRPDGAESFLFQTARRSLREARSGNRS